MMREERITERIIRTAESGAKTGVASLKTAVKGKREALLLVNQTGSIRGALYALAELAGIDWRDMPFARKIAKILMGTGDTVGRIEQSEQMVSASDKTAGRIEYDVTFRGRSAYVVITGIDDLSIDSDEVLSSIFKLTKAFRRHRSDLEGVGLNTKRMQTHFTKYTLLLEIPFSGIINEAESVLKSVLKKVR